MFKFIKKIFGKDDTSATPTSISELELKSESESESITKSTPITNIDVPIDTPNEILETSTSAPAPEPEPEPTNTVNWFNRLKAGLRKTQQQFSGIFTGTKIDEAMLLNLEEALILSDIGIQMTQKIMTQLRQHIKTQKLTDPLQIQTHLKQLLTSILQPVQQPFALEAGTTVMMVVGVNGAGKTTTIGKLCQYFHQHQQSVLLAAGDTFRAAAKEQLIAWGERNHVHVITGMSDPASLSFDAVTSGIAKRYDVVMIDTAGRLPTQTHLLAEAQKIKRSIAKAAGDAAFPHHTLLVLDGTTGQNALQQVSVFHEALGISGLIITKLDGSAKGGVLIAIAAMHQLPIYFIGVGERLEDLQTFDAKSFVDALFIDK